MRRMDKRKSAMIDGTTTLYVVILIVDIFTNGVTPMTIKSRVKFNSLSKEEHNDDKLYLADYTNNSHMKNLSLISKTFLPDIFEQEGQAKRKTTGQISTKLLHSSTSSTYTINQMVDVHPKTVLDGSDASTPTGDTDVLTFTRNHILTSDLYANNLRGSIETGNKIKATTLTTPMEDLPNHQHLITSSFGSYRAMETLQTVDLPLKSNVESIQGYPQSYHSTPVLYVKVSHSIHPVSATHPIESTSNAWEKASGLFPFSRFMPRWLLFLNKYKNIPKSSNVNTHSVGTLQHVLPATSEHTITSNEYKLTDIFVSNTDTLNSNVRPSVSIAPSYLYFNRVETPKPKSSANRVAITKTIQHKGTINTSPLTTSQETFSSKPFTENTYDVQNRSPALPSHISTAALLASSAATFMSIGSKSTGVYGSYTTTSNTDFGILPSVSIESSSDLYTNSVATPTPIIAQTIQQKRTVPTRLFKTSANMFSSKTFTEDSYHDQNYSSDLTSHISAASLLASSEQTVPLIESRLTDIFESDTATTYSDFGILPSVSIDPASNMYVKRITTHSLEPVDNHFTTASSFDAHNLEPSEGIFSSRTVIEDNYSSSSISEMSVTTSLQNSEIASLLLAQGDTERQTSVQPSDIDFHAINDLISIKEQISISPSTFQTDYSEITKLFDIETSFDSLSSMTLGVHPSYPLETSVEATGYDLPKNSQIESDKSSQLLALQTKILSFTSSNIPEFTTGTEQFGPLSTYTIPGNAMLHSTRYPSERYAYVTTEYSILLPTEYHSTRQPLITETVSLGTEQTTPKVVSSIGKTETALFSSENQGESSSINPQKKFASQSETAATIQYSTVNEITLSSTSNTDEVETRTIKPPAIDETTDMKDIVVETNGQEIKIEININNNIVNEDRKSTTTTSTTTPKPPEMPLELMVVCAYMCQQRGSPIPPFCGCTLQAWLR